MKRALAERAKQSLTPSASTTPNDTSNTSLPQAVSNGSNNNNNKDRIDAHAGQPSSSHNKNTSHNHIGTQHHHSQHHQSLQEPVRRPPLKIPRTEPIAPAPSATTTISSSTTTLSPRPTKHSLQSSLKRPLSSQNVALAAPKNVPAQDDDDNDDTSAFYLKHQNRALATELKGLQHSLASLERERDYRRQECLRAVQALNSLQATWTQLEAALFPPCQQQQQYQQQQQQLSYDGPASTGTGASVEWTAALTTALAAIGRTPVTTTNTTVTTTTTAATVVDTNADAMDDTDMDTDTATPAQVFSGDGMDFIQKASLQDLSQISANVAARATVLQEWIVQTVLQQQQQQQQQQQDRVASTGVASTTTPSTAATTTAAATQLLATKCSVLEHQVTELTASRNTVATRERRVRRNLYRLSAGMLTVEQVLQALEDSSADEKDGGADGGQDQEAVLIQRQAAEQAATVAKLQEQLQESQKAHGGGVRQDGGAATLALTATSAEVESLQAQLADFELVVSNRETSIQELNVTLNEKELLVNELSVKQRSEQETKQLQSLEQTLQKLVAANQDVMELQSKLQETKVKWALALGNEKTALETIEELQTKHAKRWSEFTSAMERDDGANEEGTGKVTPLDEQTGQAKKIIDLQHKLSQALENVRQAESTRENLKDALTMNESLTAKLDEVKSKYAAVQAARISANPRPSAGDATPKEKDATQAPTTSTSALSEKPSSSSGMDSREKAEKMHREHRRMRKELAAVTASKETAKAKLERAEKERDVLMDSNIRLLKQITEKDEMNAKSLSTILHLKSQTEQLAVERDNLEHQAKSASQLALAARLATNAKERISEEIVKEKAALNERVESLEKDFAAKGSELAKIKLERSEASGKMSTLNTEIGNALKRSNELVAESVQKQEEIRNLTDSVAKAERRAREAKAKLNEAVEQSTRAGGNSGSSVTDGPEAATESSFSVAQLSTQVSVLKSRLACPVCHYRDKECIIMRCRHMHCRKCVDDQMSSRSRKCPTCNNKFSDKDVQDIWLS